MSASALAPPTPLQGTECRNVSDMRERSGSSERTRRPGNREVPAGSGGDQPLQGLRWGGCSYVGHRIRLQVVDHAPDQQGARHSRIFSPHLEARGAAETQEAAVGEGPRVGAKEIPEEVGDESGRGDPSQDEAIRVTRTR